MTPAIRSRVAKPERFSPMCSLTTQATSLLALVALAAFAGEGQAPDVAAPSFEPGQGPGGEQAEFVRVKIHRVSPDVHTGSHVVVLITEKGDQFFPVFVGPNEGAAIARARAGLILPRPMTHDLLRNTIAKLGGEVEKVTITRIRNNTFYAEISVRTKAATIVLDARPSDSMALATRTKSPIFVRKEVLDRVGLPAEQLEETKPSPLKRKPEKEERIPPDAI